VKKLNEQQEKLVEQLLKRKNMIKGSISSVCVNCSRANCTCETKTDRRAYRLTYKEKGQKSKILYVPREEVQAVEKMILNYKQSKLIIDQLIDVNVKIFKERTKK
jgi:hypothetical protein